MQFPSNIHLEILVKKNKQKADLRDAYTMTANRLPQNYIFTRHINGKRDRKKVANKIPKRKWMVEQRLGGRAKEEP